MCLFFFFPLMVQAEHWSFASYFLKSVWNINLPDWMFHILPWENVSKILAMLSGLPRSNELDWGRMRQAGRYRAADQQRSTDSTSTGSLGRVPALEHRDHSVYFSQIHPGTSRIYWGKHQICLLRADLSIYIKSPRKMMLNLLITVDY